MISYKHFATCILILSFLLTACREDEAPRSQQAEDCYQLSDRLPWLSTMEAYGRQERIPPAKYGYNWLDAVFLKSMIRLYEESNAEKSVYLQYIENAVDNTLVQANGNTPNDIAPAAGLAFMYRVTKDSLYLEKAVQVLAGYMKIERAKNGGVSHTYGDVQLWDDTIYMIGIFLQEMYLATDEEKYLEEYINQVMAHAEVLADPATGLWYHGWDEDGENNSPVGSLPDWPNAATHRNNEFWGRGNGWILMSLADALAIIAPQHTQYGNLKGVYQKMIDTLLPLQDSVTGHWFQLPAHPYEAGNYRESSCTAMYCYAIAKGINLGILDYDKYFPAVRQGVCGLTEHSIQEIDKNFATPVNVCVGTGVGDKKYYYDRPVTRGVTFALGAFIMMGHEVEKIQAKNTSP